MRRLVVLALLGCGGAGSATPVANRVDPQPAEEPAPASVEEVCAALAPAARTPLGSPPYPAPGFTGENYRGEKISDRDYRGEPHVRHFFASWALYSNAELTLDALAKGLEGTASVVAFASDSDWERVRLGLERKLGGFPAFELLLDRPSGDDNLGATAAAHGVPKVPETVLVDRDQTVRAHIVGPRDWGSPAARACVEALAASP